MDKKQTMQEFVDTQHLQCWCAEGWVCEKHPYMTWPHDDCSGPGMPCNDAVMGILHQYRTLRELLVNLLDKWLRAPDETNESCIAVARFLREYSDRYK